MYDSFWLLLQFLQTYRIFPANTSIIFKCKDVREAVFYVQYTLENNWSRDVLEHQIESGLYIRESKGKLTCYKFSIFKGVADFLEIRYNSYSNFPY